MNGRFLARAATLVCGLFLLALLGGAHSDRRATAGDSTPGATKTDVHAPFGESRVWSIHLEIPAKEFEAMPPAFGAGFGPPPKAGARKDDRKRDSEKNLFGTDFPWAEADFTADGKTLKKVGIRYAGEMSYFASARGLKRPLKIAFDKFAAQQFLGLSSVHLHAMPLDPSRIREAVAYAIFRAMGVPAPRTAFAELTLTVPGKYDKELLGLYTVVENVDARFLLDNFNSDKGLMLKPVRMRGIDSLGDDWDRYKGQYQPHREATADEARRVIAFAKLVNQGTDEEFRQQIDSFVDVDAFLRFMAANAFVSNVDGFFAAGWNYTLYLDARTKRFAFIPGDLENSFASVSFLGTPEQLMDLSFSKPYPVTVHRLG